MTEELLISKENYNRILMWGLSTNEVNFLCLGRSNTIEKVIRLSNVSRSPKSFACWNENQRKHLVKVNKSAHQIIVASGHSHPSRYHKEQPSVLDVKYIGFGTIELIVFPSGGSIRAWKIQKNLSLTLKHEIKIVVY